MIFLIDSVSYRHVTPNKEATLEQAIQRNCLMSRVPSRVVELIETFDRNAKAPHSQQYNETQLRIKLIDPFFKELGWDVTNERGYAQAYKDVIHEDAINGV